MPTTEIKTRYYVAGMEHGHLKPLNVIHGPYWDEVTTIEEHGYETREEAVEAIKAEAEYWYKLDEDGSNHRAWPAYAQACFFILEEVTVEITEDKA